MRLAVQIINWVMGILATIATIELIHQHANGYTIGVGIAWVAQATLTLIYIHRGEK